jgi:hypothetical protein
MIESLTLVIVDYVTLLTVQLLPQLIMESESVTLIIIEPLTQLMVESLIMVVVESVTFDND